MTNATITREAEIARARKADEAIAAMWDLYWQMQNEVLRTRKAIRDAEKRRAHRAERGWPTDEAEAAIARLQEQLAPEEEAADIRREEAIALDEELYEGWTRFFLVEHIHNTQRCPSFRPTTRVGWLPEVSGLTEAEAVREYGATLCTKCFPTAPVELTQPQADPTICAGSGQMYDADHLTGRERMYYAPTGTCPICHTAQALAARGSVKMRKHKAPIVAAA